MLSTVGVKVTHNSPQSGEPLTPYSGTPPDTYIIFFFFVIWTQEWIRVVRVVSDLVRNSVLSFPQCGLYKQGSVM